MQRWSWDLIRQGTALKKKVRLLNYQGHLLDFTVGTLPTHTHTIWALTRKAVFFFTMTGGSTTRMWKRRSYMGEGLSGLLAFFPTLLCLKNSLLLPSTKSKNHLIRLKQEFNLKKLQPEEKKIWTKRNEGASEAMQIHGYKQTWALLLKTVSQIFANYNPGEIVMDFLNMSASSWEFLNPKLN